MNRLLPHQKLHAYHACRALLDAVLACHVRDAHLRDQALRAARSACLNTAEGAGRVSRGEKARSFTIARAEAGEAAAVEIANACGDVSNDAAQRVALAADRAVALLTGLVR